MQSNAVRLVRVGAFDDPICNANRLIKCLVLGRRGRRPVQSSNAVELNYTYVYSKLSSISIAAAIIPCFRDETSIYSSRVCAPRPR